MFEARTLPPLASLLTWGIVADVVEGLEQYMVVENRAYRARFEIYHGPRDAAVGVGFLESNLLGQNIAVV